MKKIILLLTAILLLSFTSDSGRSVYEIPTLAQAITSGDLDLDGDLDIITAHSYSIVSTWGGVNIMENDGNGFFMQGDTSYIYSNQTEVLLVDLHNDSTKSIIVKDFIGDQRLLHVMQKDSAGFHVNLYPVIDRFNYFNSGDINGDGYTDIVVSSNQDQYWGVLYNDGLGNLSDADYLDIPDFPPQKLACADLDGDGREDVVVTGQYTDIYFSTPVWFEKQRLDTTAPKSEVYCTDFDLDGDIDIVEFGAWGFTFGTFTENLGDRNFESHNDFYFQTNTWCNVLADFNNDSLPDVIFQTMASQDLIICYNKGNFEMSEPTLIYSLAGINSRVHFTSGDFDGNGYQDLAFTHWEGSLTILFNDGQGNFLDDPVTAIHNPMAKTGTSNNYFTCNPNPVSNEAIFSFALPEPTLAKLCVYNMQGKLVANLIADQTRNVKWDVNKNGKLTSGVYLVWLLVEGNPVESIKIVIL